jgi:hypothetical protein
MEKDAVGITTIADHMAILNFDPQVIILVEDIINSEIRLPA